MKPEPHRRYCGRDFSAADLAHLQELLGRQPALNRAQLSRQVCQDLGWRNGGGQLQAMSCRVALLRMEKDGLLQLPKPLKKNGNGRTVPGLTAASAERAPVREPVAALEPL
jgi:hypothetical protein